MKEAELIMVDARTQIRDALKAIEGPCAFSVRGTFPRSAKDGVLITFAEIRNSSTRISVVDDIAYQIDIWAFDRDTLFSLAVGANRAMLTIGFKREYSGEDEGPYDNSGYYRKTMRFGRKVDKRTMRLID